MGSGAVRRSVLQGSGLESSQLLLRRRRRRRVLARGRVCRAPQPPPPPPPPPPFSKIAFSATPGKRGLRPAAPIPGAESRVQAPSLAGDGEAESGSHTSLRVPTGTARVFFASALPPPGGGGFPAWANVVLASGDERGSGRLRRTPAAWPPFGPQLRRRCPGRAAKRRGLDAGRNPWVCAGVRAAEAERRRRAKPRVGLRGCRAAGLPERKAVCGHVVRYVLRARASSRSRATSKSGARLSRLPPRLLLTLPSCVRRGTHQYGQCREAPRGRRHPASSLQPSPRAPRPPNLPELRVLGHRLSFPMPLLAFARGRASYHLRSRGVIYCLRSGFTR
ncbi:uncharacterized protein LOC111173325 [Delphinapterus leucas]|uniref:Uncharacterized protein LOC111173325 n=1 Tax=Delphinapterus leucas TaxID=9749 RepID=A0A7F8KG85_DELLE|nr:uncharacterized protein LOC111173325 [Delphinapterus leucas]